LALALGAAVGAPAPVALAATPFAWRVLLYEPAPGQFVNNPAFNDPSRALGPPVGGGTVAPDNSSLVTLGGFGGRIVLGFDHTILDDPRNKGGLDFIVFSNALWAGGDPTRRAAEPAVVEVSLDVNGDGAPNDPWYVIPGSSLPDPPAQALASQSWDDDPATPTPPANLAWWPVGFSHSSTGFFMTTTFALPAAFDPLVLEHPDGPTATVEAHFGYAELSPTLLLGDRSGASGGAGDNSLADPEDDPAIAPEQFYTVPDDPLTVGIDPGSGGGDAFDIAWAVDPVTGAPANLPGVDFIRITSGVTALRGAFGEASPEIDAVADAAPATHIADLDGDGAVGPGDLFVLLGSWGARLSVADIDQGGSVGPGDLFMLLGSWGATGP